MKYERLQLEATICTWESQRVSECSSCRQKRHSTSLVSGSSSAAESRAQEFKIKIPILNKTSSCLSLSSSCRGSGWSSFPCGPGASCGPPGRLRRALWGSARPRGALQGISGGEAAVGTRARPGLLRDSSERLPGCGLKEGGRDLPCVPRRAVRGAAELLGAFWDRVKCHCR